MMFTFTLFDVGHGFCAYAKTPGGSDILFDCGYDNEIQFYPSTYFSDRKITRIHNLTLSHFDQDHVATLDLLREDIHFDGLSRNKSIPPHIVRREKEKQGTVFSGMESAIEMHSNWTHPLTVAPNYGGVKVKRFYNEYPAFTDMNNLSVVTFLEYEGCGVVVPGDLECVGWEALLKKPAFCKCLEETTYFIASHHGRNAGYCEEVFDHCQPLLILLSDKKLVHDTQEHDYTKHARGIPDSHGGTRRVLTTRNDGHIRIEKPSGQSVRVTYNYQLN